MFGIVLDNDSKEINITFDVDVNASAGWEWETDENPDGWNYGTDQPTYSEHTYASCSEATIHSVRFSQETNFTINGEDVSLHEAQQHIDVSIMRQLLLPVHYKKFFNRKFSKEIENKEPDDDFEPPYDSRY